MRMCQQSLVLSSQKIGIINLHRAPQQFKITVAHTMNLTSYYVVNAYNNNALLESLSSLEVATANFGAFFASKLDFGVVFGLHLYLQL